MSSPIRKTLGSARIASRSPSVIASMYVITAMAAPPGRVLAASVAPRATRLGVSLADSRNLSGGSSQAPGPGFGRLGESPGQRLYLRTETKSCEDLRLKA